MRGPKFYFELGRLLWKIRRAKVSWFLTGVKTHPAIPGSTTDFWAPQMIRADIGLTMLCPLQVIGEYFDTNPATSGRLAIMRAADNMELATGHERKALLWATRLEGVRE